MPNLSSNDQTLHLLILAPLGRDAELLQKIASEAGLCASICRTPEDFCETFVLGVGGAVITEEALYLHEASKIFVAVESQPPWSETPFIVLASRSNPEERARKTFELTRPLRNVTLIERPARASTLANAFDSILRDRKRQYEVRDALEELEQSQKALQELNSELEQRVNERTARLQTAVRELEGFTYSVSHDMRAPARGLISHARMVLEDFGDQVPEDARVHLQRLADAASKMGALVDDLLRYARLGERDVKRSTFDLACLAEEVVEVVSEDTNCPIELKPAPPLRVEADAELLKLALYNLFHNSCKYRGDREVEIELGRAQKDGKTAYYVRDNGIGFEDQYAHKLFMPFERLHRDQAYPGTGIGLANVKRIIQLHGGEVWAEGSPNQGAAFYFTLM